MRLLDAYIDGLGNSFNVKGRATRSDYFLFYLANYLLILPLVYLSPELATIYVLLTIPASFTLILRRLKDAGRSQWLILIGCIPLVGAFWMLYLTLQPSVLAPVQYDYAEAQYSN